MGIKMYVMWLGGNTKFVIWVRRDKKKDLELDMKSLIGNIYHLFWITSDMLMSC